MLQIKMEKYARILLYAAPFLVLLFFQGYYFPFVITRTVFFRLIIQLALSLYLLLLALDFKKYRPRMSWGLILVVVFLLIQLAAAALGLDFYKSFWSNFERMEGVISVIYLAAYLFLLQAFLREKKQWLFYVRLILISSLLVSLYGLAQKFDILPLFEAGIGRVTSTIGNAAFLAGYLLLAIGLGVYYYFNETDKNYRYLALAACAINTIVLLLTSTRGAILGLAVGVFFYLLFNAIFQAGRPRKISAAILAAVLIFGAAFFAFRGQLAGSNIEFVRRMATISAGEATAMNRLSVWRMALKDFKFHPLLGVGMENFEIVFNKYFTPDISENWFDRTHNVYLDQLTAGGVLGLSAYLAILVYLFYALFKNRRGDYQLFAALSAALIAYGIHNFFVFDTLNTSFLYFFLIGLIGFREKPDEPAATAPNNPAFNKAFIALAVANIVAFYQLVYLPLAIDRAIYIGYYYAVADPYRSYQNFEYALNYKLAGVEAAVQLNKMNDVVDTESGAPRGTKDKFYALTREKLESVSKEFPLDIKTKMYLAQLIINDSKDQKELDLAESSIKDSIRLSPSRVETYYLLYNLYYKEGKKAEARAVLEDLTRKLPDFGGVKIMLMADLAKEDPARAEQLYQAGSKQFGYNYYGGLKKILSYLLDQKRYAETVPYYDMLIKSEPKNYAYRVDLAKVYYLTNRLELAVDQLNVINAESPATLEANKDFVNLVFSAYYPK